MLPCSDDRATLQGIVLVPLFTRLQCQCKRRSSSLCTCRNRCIVSAQGSCKQHASTFSLCTLIPAMQLALQAYRSQPLSVIRRRYDSPAFVCSMLFWSLSYPSPLRCLLPHVQAVAAASHDQRVGMIIIFLLKACLNMAILTFADKLCISICQSDAECIDARALLLPPQPCSTLVSNDQA